MSTFLISYLIRMKSDTRKQTGHRYYRNMWAIDPGGLARSRANQLQKTQEEFAELAGISVAAVRRAEQGKRISIENADAIAGVHKKACDQLFSTHPPAAPQKHLDMQSAPSSNSGIAGLSKPLKQYTWEDMETGAEQVGKTIFKEFCADAVLTFPGPSLIFAGLAMAKALLQACVRMPVYTVIFVGKEVAPETFPEFDPVTTTSERFKILVPKALTQNDPERKNKIVIVDDSIITGISMDALRNYFLAELQPPYRRENI